MTLLTTLLLRLTILTRCFISVDASSELKARGVESGDKVLEVNDIMVTDATVDRVNKRGITRVCLSVRTSHSYFISRDYFV